MSIRINFKKNITKKASSNLVLFTDEKYSTKSLKKYISSLEFSYISDLLKTSDLSKKLFVFELSSKKKIVLVSLKKDIKTSDIENLGAELYNRINYGKNSDYLINLDSVTSGQKNFIGHFLHGLKLKSYEFHKYKSKKDTRLITINLSGNKNKPSANDILKFQALEEGTFYARDLVSEPGNILHVSIVGIH